MAVLPGAEPVRAGGADGGRRTGPRACLLCAHAVGACSCSEAWPTRTRPTTPRARAATCSRRAAVHARLARSILGGRICHCWRQVASASACACSEISWAVSMLWRRCDHVSDIGMRESIQLRGQPGRLLPAAKQYQARDDRCASRLDALASTPLSHALWSPSQAEDSRRDRRDDGTCGSRELFLLAQHSEAENPYSRAPLHDAVPAAGRARASTAATSGAALTDTLLSDLHPASWCAISLHDFSWLLINEVFAECQVWHRVRAPSTCLRPSLILLMTLQPISSAWGHGSAHPQGQVEVEPRERETAVPSVVVAITLRIALIASAWAVRAGTRWRGTRCTASRTRR